MQKEGLERGLIQLLRALLFQRPEILFPGPKSHLPVTQIQASSSGLFMHLHTHGVYIQTQTQAQIDKQTDRQADRQTDTFCR